jgi:hypothetical protein
MYTWGLLNMQHNILTIAIRYAAQARTKGKPAWLPANDHIAAITSTSYRYWKAAKACEPGDP